MATSTFNLSTLNGSNGFVLNGIDSGDRSGHSVSSAGDVNDDSIDDIIIGAPGNHFSGSALAGESYVVFGTSTGFASSIELSALNGPNGFVLNGIESTDLAGFSVSGAGDVNDDGIDDIIIGAPDGDPNGNINAGESYVVFGSATGFTSSFELSALDGSNGFVLNGVDNFDVSGRSVSSAGDVNDDGIDDIIIGAVRAAPNGNRDVGESYVVFGSATGFASSFELSTLDGSNGFVLKGIDRDDFSGRSVSSAGDVNSDGIDDIIIGARNADPNDQNLAGESYVVFGSATDFDASFELSALDGSNGFVINGVDSVDSSGGSVSSAGDVNGDGIDDIIIGARYAVPNSNAGRSYVVFGSATDFDASLELSTLDGSNGFAIDGIGINDSSGRSVSSVGDVNGDGIDDIIIGANAANGYTGESYVVFGSAMGFDASLELSTLDGSNGVALSGIDNGDFSGRPVSSAGDVNGDGIDDIIIGAPPASPNDKNFAGESYVVFGNDEVPIIDLNGSENAIAGFVLSGIDSGDRSGHSVSSAGDVNGDGVDDLIIGALGADPSGKSSAGESYVIFGTTTGFDASVDLSALDGSSGFVLNGIASGDQASSSVSSAGDVNGDGIDDLIISAPGANPSGNLQAGESYVVFGSITGFAASFELSALDGSNGFVLNGIASGDISGISVSSAGDVNGDGIDDIIIGAPGADPNGNRLAGESYVIFGSSTGFAASLDLSALDGSNGFVLNGIDSGDISGISVSSAGDVNGDDIDDLVIGADGAEMNDNRLAGESYVVFGSSTGFAANFELSALDGSNGFVLIGIDSLDRSGRSVSSAGDVNGDRIDDIIIGASSDPNGNGNAGESYVVFGSSTGFAASLDLSALDGSNGFVLNGTDSGDQTGISVSSAGDVNGDDIDDIIIGARLADPNDNGNAGESYVVFGSSTGFAASLDLSALNGSNGFVLNGIDSFDFSGFSVGSAGDVNGDRIDDLIIGAFGANPNGNSSAGESYVVLGAIGIGSSGSLNLADISATDSVGAPGIDFTTAYDGNPTAIVSSDLDIDAGPSAFLQGATITLTNRPDGIRESLLADVTGTAIVANYDAATGILTLSGTDTIANYEQVLRTLQYSNSDTTPGTTDRIIEVMITSDQAINNMSAVAISTVTFDIPDNDIINGTPGNDTITGTPDDDIINGLGGNDIIIGLSGNDTINGNAGNDTILGGDGDDLVIGGNGGDTLVGGGGDDRINGGRGNDFLFGSEGNDRINGGRGNDFLFGDEGNDRINGGEGRDTLYGGNGDDRINGQAGNDILIGVDPNAATPGSGERDMLFGGQGADRFVLGDDSNVFYFGNGNADFARVQDFNAAEGDRIQLSGSSSDYSLRTFGGGTRIFANDGNTTDLVGVVRGVSFTEFGSEFTFV